MEYPQLQREAPEIPAQLLQGLVRRSIGQAFLVAAGGIPADALTAVVGVDISMSGEDLTTYTVFISGPEFRVETSLAKLYGEAAPPVAFAMAWDPMSIQFPRSSFVSRWYSAEEWLRRGYIISNPPFQEGSIPWGLGVVLPLRHRSLLQRGGIAGGPGSSGIGGVPVNVLLERNYPDPGDCVGRVAPPVVPAPRQPLGGPGPVAVPAGGRGPLH